MSNPEDPFGSLTENDIINTDDKLHTVGEILEHITKIREYLISGLIEMDFEPVQVEGEMDRKRDTLIFRRWDSTTGHLNLWLTVMIVTRPTYINVWVDKLWDDYPMGHGFYQVRLDWWASLFHFLYLVALVK